MSDSYCFFNLEETSGLQIRQSVESLLQRFCRQREFHTCAIVWVNREYTHGLPAQTITWAVGVKLSIQFDVVHTRCLALVDLIEIVACQQSSRHAFGGHREEPHLSAASPQTDRRERQDAFYGSRAT